MNPGLLVLAGLALWWWLFLFLLVSLALFRWLTLLPSNQRDWAPEYARITWSERQGDEVTIHNFRHSRYRTATDFVPG